MESRGSAAVGEAGVLCNAIDKGRPATALQGSCILVKLASPAFNLRSRQSNGGYMKDNRSASAQVEVQLPFGTCLKFN